MQDESTGFRGEGQEQVESERSFKGLERHTGINEFTSTPQIRNQIFDTFVSLQGRPIKEYGTNLLPFYDTLHKLSRDANESGRTAGANEYAQLAGGIKNVLTGNDPQLTGESTADFKYPPNLFDSERVQRRMSELSQENVARRAELLGKPMPSDLEDAIPFVYGDISEKVIGNQIEAAEEPGANDYYRQFPELDLQVGQENFRDILINYDQVMGEVLLADQNKNAQTEADFVIPTEYQGKLAAINAKVGGVEMPDDLKAKLLASLSLHNTLRRTSDQAERTMIQSTDNPRVILGLNPNLQGKVEPGVLTKAYRDRVRVFHTDLSDSAGGTKQFDWEVYRGKDAGEIVKKINVAYGTLKSS